MASTLSSNNLFITVVIMTALAALVEARPLNHHGSDLAARLKVESSTSSCWESLFHLQSCTGEVVVFFLNGETYLGAGCCRAIRIIEHECWPDMLGSLGFTTQEGDILQGYCDAELHSHSPPPPPPPPPVTMTAAVGDVTSGN